MAAPSETPSPESVADLVAEDSTPGLEAAAAPGPGLLPAGAPSPQISS